jgi:hypothetical protein
MRRNVIRVGGIVWMSSDANVTPAFGNDLGYVQETARRCPVAQDTISIKLFRHDTLVYI